MSRFSELQNLTDNPSPFSPGKVGIWVVLTFLMVFVGGNVVGQNPIYSHDAPNSLNLDDFSITIADAVNSQAKLNRLIIAVDINPLGERFVLTFGNGIKRLGNTGLLIDFIPNQNDRLSNSLDFAINSEGKFFVATNESNRRFIRVYSPTGVYLPNETLGDGTYDSSGANKFKGPTGLAFDKDDNLYVADHYIGDANPPRPSSIKIYRKDNSGNYKNNLITEFDNIKGTLLNFPYRLAVNSQGHLYMAEMGQDGNAKVKILQFDAGFNPTQIDEITGAASQIGSPGSIIIDKFDNIFVADLGNDLNLPRVLGATNNVDEFYEIFEIIKSGIQNNLFHINVYNPNNSFNKRISSQIDFPVDLAISKCGTLYVNNAIFDGTIKKFCIPFINLCTRIPDITIDFDLEAYQRTPGYDTEKPILVECPPDQTETLTKGQFILPDYRVFAEFSDNCDDDLEIIQDPPKNTSISETTTVTITAKDNAGNVSDICSFSVKILEVPKPSFSCPVVTDIPDLFFDSNCNFIEPDLSVLLSGFINFKNTQYFVQTSNRTNNILAVKIKVYDGQNGDLVDECNIDVNLVDNLKPIINCPTSPQTISKNSAGKYILPDYSNLASDNCDPDLSVTQNPLPVEITSNTTVTIIAADAAGNVSDTCTFMVNLAENEILEITCPSDQVGQLDLNCQFTIPDYKGLTTINFQNAIIKQSPLAGTIVSESITIKLTATLDGQIDVCLFQLILEDTISPVANCLGEYSLSLNANGIANLSAAQIDFNSTDNCGIASMVIDKTLFNFNELGENTVILTVTDTAGNEDSCTTIVRVLIGNYVPGDFECKSPVVIQLNETGNAVLNAEDLYSGDAGDRIFTISKSEFDCSNMGANVVTLTYTGSDGSGTCEINVIVEDRISPETRTRNINVTLNSSGTATITPEMIDNGSTDNCGKPQLSLDVTTFNCDDLGENTVFLSATDVSGNFTKQPATITVSGICKEFPETGFEFILIYPNPTPGPFTFDMPTGWSLEKVEVYDARGRYVLTETYSENQFQYSMDLSSLQQSVYILKLYTSQGIRIIRVIIY